MWIFRPWSDRHLVFLLHYILIASIYQKPFQQTAGIGFASRIFASLDQCVAPFVHMVFLFQGAIFAIVGNLEVLEFRVTPR